MFGALLGLDLRIKSILLMFFFNNEDMTLTNFMQEHEIYFILMTTNLIDEI